MQRTAATSLRLIGAAIVVVVALGAPTRSLAGPPPTTLPGTVPRLVRAAVEQGADDPSRRVHIGVALATSSRADLTGLIDAQYTPGSAEFHRFLSPDQFGARFGASQTAVDRASRALSDLGFIVSPAAPNHLLLDATASVAQAEAAFGVTIDRFTGPDGRAFYANTGDIQLPSSLSGLVTSVFGLDNANERAPNLASRVPVRGTGPPAALATPVGAVPCPQAKTLSGGGYTAPELAAAYGFDGLYLQGLDGQGMTAALAEFDDYQTADVATFEQCYLISPDPVHRHLIDAGSGAPPFSGEIEDTLDIDIMLEMLPQLKNLTVYVAPNTDTSALDLLNAFATDRQTDGSLTPVLSDSWGNCELVESLGYATEYEAMTEEAAAQGQQIIQAAGDTGPIDCIGQPAPTGTTINVAMEAAVPSVTAVGGTNLPPSALSSVGSNAARTEVTWNDFFGAGGGGISHLWTMPAWQRSGGVIPAFSSGAPCGAPSSQLCRQVPDISADAAILGAPRIISPPNPQGGSIGYSFYCGDVNCQFVSGVANGWQVNGGTSAATPLTASAVVLWDQMARAEGLTTLGLINPALYRIGSDATKAAADFHDITSDSNSDEYAGCPTASCNPNHIYPASVGYDLATGWGTYDATNLGRDVVADAAHVDMSPDDVPMYGYLGGPQTTRTLVVSTGYQSAGQLRVSSDATWLSGSLGAASGRLLVTTDPAGLGPGDYVGHVVVAATASSASATATVRYSVTPRATMALDKADLHFAERATSGTSGCTSKWDDEFDDATNYDPHSLQTLSISNTGPANSQLHWAAVLATDASSWLSPDLLNGLPVATSGDLQSGQTYAMRLASVASTGPYFPGVYDGSVTLTDLADPAVRVVVPATTVLGDGTGTPLIAASPNPLSVEVAPGAMTTVTLSLSDAGARCGYNFSVASDASWASLADPGYSGTVSPTTPTELTVTIDATHLQPGTYVAHLQVGSDNAEPQPYTAAIALGVGVSPPVLADARLPALLVTAGLGAALAVMFRRRRFAGGASRTG